MKYHTLKVPAFFRMVLEEARQIKPEPAAINGHSNTNAVLTAIIPKGSHKNNIANIVAINLQNNDTDEFNIGI